MTKLDTFFACIAVATCWTGGASESLDLLELAHHVLKDLHILTDRGQHELLGETVFNHVGQGQMNLTRLDVRVRAIKLSIRLF